MHGWTQGPSEPGPSASATICLARKACLLPVSLDVTAPGAPGVLRVLSLSRLAPEKNLDVLLEAFARVREQVGSRKVLLGLSGGVDSSVVAALLPVALLVEGVVGWPRRLSHPVAWIGALIAVLERARLLLEPITSRIFGPAIDVARATSNNLGWGVIGQISNGKNSQAVSIDVAQDVVTRNVIGGITGSILRIEDRLEVLAGAISIPERSHSGRPARAQRVR